MVDNYYFFFPVHHLLLGEMPFPHFYVTLLCPCPHPARDMTEARPDSVLGIGILCRHTGTKGDWSGSRAQGSPAAPGEETLTTLASALPQAWMCRLPSQAVCCRAVFQQTLFLCLSESQLLFLAPKNID